MKKVKKWLCLLLCAAVLFSLAACGKNEPTAPTESIGEEDGRTDIVLSINKSTDWGLNSLSAAVTKFNRTNEKYRVVYGDYENNSVLEAAIAAGTGPDIFVDNLLGSLPFSDFTYENLLPYMEADMEVGVGVYEEGLLNALVKNESVFFLPVFYEIVTFIIPEHMVDPSQRSITMEQAESLTEELGDNCHVFPAWLDQDAILSYIMYFSLGKYIDWEIGDCDFDSPEFIALLEDCNKQVPRAIVNGDMNPEILERNSLLGVCRIMRASCLSSKENNAVDLNVSPTASAGTGYRYIGFPNEDGNGSMFSPTPLVAISAVSENKEGAWEFISFILSEEVQSDEIWYLPVNRRALEKQIELGFEGKLKRPMGTYTDFVTLDQNEVDKFLDLLEHMETVEAADPVIIPIINDEVQALYDGSKTAQEVAEIIQSRVSIYISEQS